MKQMPVVALFLKMFIKLNANVSQPLVKRITEQQLNNQISHGKAILKARLGVCAFALSNLETSQRATPLMRERQCSADFLRARAPFKDDLAELHGS